MPVDVEPVAHAAELLAQLLHRRVAGTAIVRSIANTGAPVTGAGSSVVSMLSMFTSKLRSTFATWCTRPGLVERLPRQPVRQPRRGRRPDGRVDRAWMAVSPSASRSLVIRSIASCVPPIDITIANWPCMFAMRLSSMLPPREKTNSETSSTSPGRSSPIAVSTVRVTAQRYRRRPSRRGGTVRSSVSGLAFGHARPR